MSARAATSWGVSRATWTAYAAARWGGDEYRRFADDLFQETAELFDVELGGVALRFAFRVAPTEPVGDEAVVAPCEALRRFPPEQSGVPGPEGVKQDHRRRGALAGPGQVDEGEPLTVDLDVPDGAPPGSGQPRGPARNHRVDDGRRPERHPAQKQAAGHPTLAKTLQFLIGGPCHDADNNSEDAPIPSTEGWLQAQSGCVNRCVPCRRLPADGVHNRAVAFEIVVVWVGRRREPWESLIGDYRRRIQRFVPVREQMVRPARGDDRTRLRLEGNAIRAVLPAEAWTVCLDRLGRKLSSSALAPGGRAVAYRVAPAGRLDRRVRSGSRP